MQHIKCNGAFSLNLKWIISGPVWCIRRNRTVLKLALFPDVLNMMYKCQNNLLVKPYYFLVLIFCGLLKGLLKMSQNMYC